MTTPAANFRSLLREKGLQLNCQQQETVRGTDHRFELWAACPEDGGRLQSFVIYDMGADGYTLFLMNDAIRFDADVAAVLAALGVEK